MPETRLRGGFTLIELMVVIVILGGLIAIVGPNVVGSVDTADRRRAEAQMANFAHAVTQYYVEYRRLPASLDQLAEPDPKTGEPLLERIPKDPWHNDYGLRRLDGRRFEITCAGRDGVEGTDDDLVWPAVAEE